MRRPIPFKTRSCTGRKAKTIESVIVVAGVSCTGKTTFLRKLTGPRPPRLPPDLQSFDLAQFTVLNAIDLTNKAAAPRAQRIILHYDIFRPLTFYDTLNFHADPVLDLLRDSRFKAVLTLWEDPDLLRERAMLRRRNLWLKLVRRSSLRNLGANVAEWRGASLRRRKMQPWFADRDRLQRLYDMWFDFVRAAGVESHWLARPSEGMIFTALGENRPAVMADTCESPMTRRPVRCRAQGRATLAANAPAPGCCGAIAPDPDPGLPALPPGPRLSGEPR